MSANALYGAPPLHTRIVDLITTRGPLTQREVSETLGLARSGVSLAMRELVKLRKLRLAPEAVKEAEHGKAAMPYDIFRKQEPKFKPKIQPLVSPEDKRDETLETGAKYLLEISTERKRIRGEIATLQKQLSELDDCLADIIASLAQGQEPPRRLVAAHSPQAESDTEASADSAEEGIRVVRAIRIPEPEQLSWVAAGSTHSP